MANLRPRQLPDYLLSNGKSVFTTEEARDLLNLSSASTRRALARLRVAKQVFSPAQSFWVVIPPEHRGRGAVPPIEFIDSMMKTLGIPYYVALLSAAELHLKGVAASDCFQVMCAAPPRARSVAGTHLRFYGGRHLEGAEMEAQATSTGRVLVSTLETTVVDLIDRPGGSGSLSNVAGILTRLDQLNGRRLTTLARRRRRSVLRRLGWMVERFGRCSDIDALRDAAEIRAGAPVLLCPAAGSRGKVASGWNVRVNVDVEPHSNI
jgi:predicted transcriptional regulator of viral defense system